MVFVNGHSIKYYRGSECWVVDGKHTYYSIFTLSQAVGVSYEDLISVLPA